MAEYSSKFSRGTYLSLVLASQGSFEVVPKENCSDEKLYVIHRKPSSVKRKEYSSKFNAQ
jgi:hypothetical protein